MKKYKLSNKRRFYGAISFAIIILLIGMLLVKHQTAQGESIDKYDIVTVQNGDTLWDIAAKYNNNNYSDLREYVYIIKKENNIYGDFLIPNQKLRVPRV